MAQVQLQAFDHSTQQQQQQQQHTKQPSSVRPDQDSRGSKVEKKQHARDVQPAARSLPQPRARPAGHPADVAGSPQHAGRSQNSSDGDLGSSDSPHSETSQTSDSEEWPDASTGQAPGAGDCREQQQQLQTQQQQLQTQQQHKQERHQEQRKQVAVAAAHKQHKARNKSSREQQAAVATVAMTEAVAQTDEYVPPLVGQLQAEAQVLREQLSKLAGKLRMRRSRQQFCPSSASTSDPSTAACCQDTNVLALLIWHGCSHKFFTCEYHTGNSKYML
jgi:DNA mismatch repair ATPase MutL